MSDERTPPGPGGDTPDGWPPQRRPKPGRRPGSTPELSPEARAKLLGALIPFALLVTVALLVLTGRMGVRNIAPDQVAVKVNYLTGSRTAIVNPGYQFYAPLMHELYVLDKSNFRFERLDIQYQVEPSSAVELLEQAGPGDGYKLEWVKTYARSILRDEFGRYSAEEIADPGILQAAFASATERMSEALAPYGLRVLAIPQQKPVFDAEYEDAIEDRKVTDQDVERLVAMQDQLEREREQRLAAVERMKSIEMESLRGDLDKERLEAERAATQTRKAADAFKIGQLAEGEAQKQQLMETARGLEQKYTKEAEGVTAQAEALASRGEVVVREALIEKLKGIRFTLVPYSRDPAPQRLEHSGLGQSDANRAAAAGGEGL
jgi:membrane protease subunit HflC